MPFVTIICTFTIKKVMAKIKLSRPHNGHDEGDEIEIPEGQVQYFEQTGLSVKGEKLKYNNKKEKHTYKNK